MTAKTPTTIGYTWCNDPISGYRCDQFYVRVEAAYNDYALNCHETGHAIGLTHGQNAEYPSSNSDSRWGCLRTPWDPSHKDLGANQVTNINSEW